MNADLRHWALQQPERPALDIGNQALRYGELEARVNQLARVFKAYGLVRGDHVAALLANSAFPLILAWAAWRSGLYFTPVSTALSIPDAAHILRDCRARLVLVGGQFAAQAAALRERVDTVVHWLSCDGRLDGFAAVEAAMSGHPCSPRDDESPGALMLYTSGTTGAPRGVWRPLPVAAGQGAPPFAADLIALFKLDADVRYLSTAPLYHAAPLRFALALTAAGGRVHGLEKFEPAAALQALAELGITHSQWVPTMFQRLLQLPHGLREVFRPFQHAVAIHAAAPCPPSVKRAMIAWWGPILLEYYSGTEGVGLTMIDSHEWDLRPGSVGRAHKGVPQIVDESGQALPAGQIGRIYFSGVSPFQYFGDPQKTSARTSTAGWQTLGDIGYLDDLGYLYLTCRRRSNFEPLYRPNNEPGRDAVFWSCVCG